MFDRVDAKLRARASMKGAYPNPMLMTLVYILLTSGVAALINALFSSGSIFELMTYLNYVEDPEIIFTYYLPRIMSAMTATSALSILIGLYQSVMSFGYHSYGLRLARNEQPGYKCLFDGFAKFGRVLLMMFLIGLFTMLWTLLGLLPYTVLIFVAIFTESAAALILAILLGIAGGLFGTYMGLRYTVSPFVLIDQPELTAAEAIGRSKDMMRGHVWECFVMDLSFLGWALLAPLTLGILNLWLNPYRMATYANFYDWLAHGWTGAASNGAEPQAGSGPEIRF